MAQGDIQIIKCPLPNGPQSKMYITLYASTGNATNYSSGIKEGEPVEITTAGYYYVRAAVSGGPTVGYYGPANGPRFIGFAAGNENQNGNRNWVGYADKNVPAGSVPVYILTPGNVYIGTVYGGATMLQSTYNALVNQYATLDLTGGTYTVLTGHQSTALYTGGLTIEWIDVNKYPAKIAFSVRQSCKYAD